MALLVDKFTTDTRCYQEDIHCSWYFFEKTILSADIYRHMNQRGLWSLWALDQHGTAMDRQVSWQRGPGLGQTLSYIP